MPVESRIPETFSTIKSKMNGNIRFAIEQMNLALDEVCASREYTAKDKLKATQDYLSMFMRLENEIMKEQEFKETMKHRKLTTKIKQAEVADIEEKDITTGLTPLNRSKFSPSMSGNFS